MKHNKAKRNKADYVYIKIPPTVSPVFILKQPVCKAGCESLFVHVLSPTRQSTGQTLGHAPSSTFLRALCVPRPPSLCPCSALCLGCPPSPTYLSSQVPLLLGRVSWCPLLHPAWVRCSSLAHHRVKSPHRHGLFTCQLPHQMKSYWRAGVWNCLPLDPGTSALGARFG